MIRRRTGIRVRRVGLLAVLAGTIALAPDAVGAGGLKPAPEVKRRDALTGIARRSTAIVREILTSAEPARPRSRPSSRLANPGARGRQTGVSSRPARSGVRAKRAALRPSSARDVFAIPPANVLLAIPDVGAGAPEFAWPVDGAVSSAFGWRWRAWHRGVDIAAAQGTAIYAAAAGVVTASGIEPRYGRVVKIEHEGGFVTVYAHNLANGVEVGDRVVAGQAIGTVGQTGSATSPHVHFEIRLDGRAVNPLYLLPLPPRVIAVELAAEAELEDDDDE